MSNAFFQFKQFTVWHDRSAMKVGTDGVLLGAWCSVDGARTALDVGTGSGLIALMMAQRNEHLEVLGVDIDENSVLQAQENAKRSPFAERLRFQQTDVRTMVGRHEFDLVVSNPPFYTTDTISPQVERGAARNAKSLPFKLLMEKAVELMKEDGRFCVVIPYAEASPFILDAASVGLSLSRRCDVKATPRKAYKRSLLEFVLHPQESVFEELVLDSEAYKELVIDFYLNK